jgi:uncharacterized repeat protein (TIGR01451 family)
MNTKIKYLISGFIILIAISAYLISEQEIEPPPAILKIDGKEQISGIGPYCWWGFLKGMCTDMIGLPTAQEPLIARSPFTAHLTLPVRELPYELRLNVFRGGEEDEINFSGRGWRWWKVREENVFNLPLENEQDIELSLDPGLYVLNVDAWWYEKGSASYGFLVEVRANDTGAVSTKVQGAKITGDIGVSIGYSGENQTDSQKISWTVSIANTGAKTAKNVTAYVILPPGIVSRLDALQESIVLGDLESEVQAGFKGNATFNASGLSKQDMMAWEPLVKIKVTWTEDGKVNEKILPDEASK